jgi:pimeloyl-ACP methyl ester carboxylesterase
MRLRARGCVLGWASFIAGFASRTANRVMTSTAGSAGPQRLAREDGVSIAYHGREGKSPGIVFMGGFASDMTGAKALAIEEHARAAGQAFVRFDYRGHGQSGGRFEDGTIGAWTEDALAVLDTLTHGRQILVGSSMGGWIALLCALRRPERVAGLFLIAAAPDFVVDLIWDRLTPDQRATLKRAGVMHQPSAHADKKLTITYRLIEEGRRHRLLRAPIAIDAPVRLLHGMEDPDVPWQRSLRLAERLSTRDVRISLIKDGDHRLSRPGDLALLTAEIASLSATARRARGGNLDRPA